MKEFCSFIGNDLCHLEYHAAKWEFGRRKVDQDPQQTSNLQIPNNSKGGRTAHFGWQSSLLCENSFL